MLKVSDAKRFCLICAS